MEKWKKHLKFSAIIFIFTTGILFPFRSAEDGAVLAEKDAIQEYKAITYNIHRGSSAKGFPSLSAMVKLLKEESADFIALQEVDRYRVRSLIQDQAVYFAEQLGMDYVFGANVQNGVAQYGNLILSRYPILESGQVQLRSGKEPRSILWAKVLTEKGNLYLTSIHLGLDTVERTSHFSIIKSFLAEIVGDDPVLIMGDFNTLPDHPEMERLYKEVSGKQVPNEVPTFYHKKVKRDVQIDYIFGKGIREKESYALPSQASDHYPLILIFQIETFPYPYLQLEMRV